MKRRDFLKALGLTLPAAAAAMTLDPERLLWVPGAKTFFFPAVLQEPAIVEAQTIHQAVRQGLVAVFPGGQLLDLGGMDEFLERERRSVEAMGGRWVSRSMALHAANLSQKERQAWFASQAAFSALAGEEWA